MILKTWVTLKVVEKGIFSNNHKFVDKGDTKTSHYTIRYYNFDIKVILSDLWYLNVNMSGTS